MNADDLVTRLGAGTLLSQLQAALEQVGADVVLTGKKGSVVITITVTNAEIGDRQLVLDTTVQRKLPARAPRGIVVWESRGRLYQNDPLQERMPLPREVEFSDIALRGIEDAAASLRDIR